MPGWASAAKSFAKNKMTSEWVVSAKKLLKPKDWGRLARYGSIGAGMGAVRGMADNLIGQDRTSVLGGAIQGGIYGAAFFGLAGAWKYGRGMRKTSLAARRGVTTGGQGIMDTWSRGRGPLKLPYTPTTAGGYPGRMV